MAPSITLAIPDWTHRPVLNHMANANRSSAEVTFICRTVRWGGLAYLAWQSKVIKPRCPDCSDGVTIMLPDYSSRVVKVFLNIISTGESVSSRQQDVAGLDRLSSDLGVRQGKLIGF